MADLLNNQLTNSFLFVNTEPNFKFAKIDDDHYELSGHLVKFKKDFNDNNDFVNDFFTADTDFGLHKSSPVFYQHLQDSLLQAIPLSNELGSLKMTNDGVWIDSQLNISRTYAEMVAKKYGVPVDDYLEAVNSIVKMADAGVLGWSSGVAGHQMKSVPTTHGNFMKMWHLGSDATVTPNPSEFKTIPQFQQVMPFKSFFDLHLQNPTLKMFVNSDENAVAEKPIIIPAEMKAGRMLSTANVEKLTSIQASIEELLGNAKTGNNALTDNAPENDESALDMSGMEIKNHSMNPDSKKKKCESCSMKEMKFAHIEPRMKAIDYANVKAVLTDRYDATWLLEDVARVLWGRMEFLDIDAIANALRETADFLVELKNDSASTKNVETEKPVLSETKTVSENTDTSKDFSKVFESGLDSFVN